ncbi:hypothetical protein GA707_13975 [Nostocoides sp. F2B08]|uniref:hypothetical protein n=1 Tax=Nostocoides sp. F2B08 TaxID=2653936 RepID=UPI0012630B51|nr:hypothetical protein [Tetrasphaera sp. F2B08]KAB7743221.1 hypothetical protein GA707_13975 [Tetrasphaera sp. F2B08]
MSWIDAVGWAGSALLIFSLLQARVLRLRILNLVACLVLVFFNAVIEVWPMVAMNIVLAGINIFFITKLLRERHDEDAYAVVEVDEGDAYLEHFVRTHEGEIGHFFPHFFGEVASAEGRIGAREDRFTYLVLQGDETVGVVVVRDAGDGVAQIELDYVTPKYRDFTPGEFVYRRSGLFTDRGFTSVRTPPDMVAPYYERLGFAREGTSWRLEVH